jgi:hypothetical protein
MSPGRAAANSADLTMPHALTATKSSVHPEAMRHDGIRTLAFLAAGIALWVIVGLVLYLDWISDMPPSFMFD